MPETRNKAIRLAIAACAIAASGVLTVIAWAGERPAEEAARVAAVTAPTEDFSTAEPFEANPGGAATVYKPRNGSIFSHPSGNMSFERQLDFRVGDGVFRKLWVSAPSSTVSSDGLGPLFNARSCQSCHLKDGRGRPPGPDEAAVSLFLRLSIPPQTGAEAADLAAGRRAVIPEPTYGGQLQSFSIQGTAADGRMQVTYTEVPVTLDDGTRIFLRQPSYEAVDLAYGPLHPDAMLSPRLAPAMIGMGLLEAIPEADILALADPDDADEDGISGRPNRSWNEAEDRLVLGRFGWKAGKPGIAAQSAGAFAGDMGLSSPDSPDNWGDCSTAQAACREAPHGGDPDEGVEVTRELFDLVVFYSRNLGVPARDNVDGPQVLAGKELFYESGCIACHTPKFVTRRDSDEPEQSFQLIWPYSDLLLHDMGDGLADGRPEGRANGREWRTAPLWGLGLTETVSGHTFMLHDGRARGPLEAILWHGGEAQESRDRVAAMSKPERDALLAFLMSL